MIPKFRHMVRHVDWWVMSLIWFFLASLAWRSPLWWLAVLLMVAIPTLIAIQGHLLLCNIDRRLKPREHTEQELREAIDDLWGCIGFREIQHLQPVTREIAQENHTLVSHAEHSRGSESD